MPLSLYFMPLPWKMPVFRSCIHVYVITYVHPYVHDPIRLRLKCLSNPLAGKRDIAVTILVRCISVRPCVRPDLSRP